MGSGTRGFRSVVGFGRGVVGLVFGFLFCISFPALFRLTFPVTGINGDSEITECFEGVGSVNTNHEVFDAFSESVIVDFREYSIVPTKLSCKLIELYIVFDNLLMIIHL